jgi:hypothetical protein
MVHPAILVRIRSSSFCKYARWLSKIRSISVLGSARTASGSAIGLRRRRRFLIVLAIGLGAGAATGCRWARRFRLGMSGSLASSW